MKRILVWILVLLALAGSLAFVVAHWNVRVHRIDSGSMTGAIPQGALVVTCRTGGMQLHRRDVITFRNPEDKAGVTTHTFLGFRKDGTLVTHGDANPSLDNFDRPLRRADVIGKVVGHIDVFTPAFWKNWRGVLFVGAFVLIALAWWLSDERQPGKKGATNPV